MALERRDAVRDATTTTGTGTVTLAGSSAPGHRAFASAGFTTGATVRYHIRNADESEWEVGQGVWTSSGGTLTRAIVFASSNSGSLVNFSAGTKLVDHVITARDARPARTCLRRASTQSIPNNTWTAVAWDTEDQDELNAFSAGGLTVPVGVSFARFFFGGLWQSNNTGQRWSRLDINGATEVYHVCQAASESCHYWTTRKVPVTPGHVVALYVYQNCGAALNLAQHTNTFLDVEWE